MTHFTRLDGSVLGASPSLASWVAGLLAAVAAGAACAAASLLTPLTGPEATPPPPWHVSGLPDQQKPLTRYSLVDLDGRRVLRIEADQSYGNLVHLLAPGAPRRLTWQWRLDEPNDAADLTQRSGDDSPAKVCVFFDLPLDAMPFGQRQLLRYARSRTTEPLPGATLCYVWDAHLPAGRALASPFTSQVREIVLEGGDAPLHRWRTEQRDVQADFLAAFADETKTVPPVIGVAVGADADNTHRHSVSYLSDLALEP